MSAFVIGMYDIWDQAWRENHGAAELRRCRYNDPPIKLDLLVVESLPS